MAATRTVTRTKTPRTAPVVKLTKDKKGRVVNADKTVSVGKPTFRMPVTEVFGIEFEQGTDGATFGKAQFSPDGTRYWGYQNISLIRFIKVPEGYVLWFRAYATDRFYTAMFITDQQFNQYCTVVDFDTPDTAAPAGAVDQGYF